MTLKLAPLALLAALAAPSAVNAASFDSRTERRSAAHPRLVLAPRITPTATLRVVFHTGAADDGQQAGITRLGQHMLLEGNKRGAPEALHRKLYAASATLTVETTVRQAIFELTAPRGRFDALALEVLDLLFRPKLSEAGLSRARALTLADELESGGTEELVSFVASRLVLEGTADGGDYNTPRYGDAEVVSGLGFEQVQRHVSQKLTPANATVIVAGAFDEKRFKKALSRWRGGRARPFDRPVVAPYLPLAAERYAPREVHLHAQLLDLQSPEDAAAARLLTAVLEERVMWELRKKGVTYSTAALAVLREWADLIVVVVPVGEAKEVVVEVELRKLLDELALGHFLGEEFERNKAYVLAELERIDGDPLLLARELSMAPERVPWFAPTTAAALKRLSQARFVQIVSPWLAKKRSISVLFGRSRAVPATR